MCIVGWLLTPVYAEDRGMSLNRITTPAGEQIDLYNESHALVIGVSDYTNGWPDLPGVKKDVSAIQTALKTYGFQIVTVEDPTFTELEQAFRDFINQYGQDSENRLLFYFSGHGHTVKLAYGDEMGYIVPTDAPNPNQDEAGFTATAVDMQMIEVYAKRIQSKHAIFLFDSCFSGSIFSLTRAVPENISYKTAQPVRQFLTSGSADEQVPDESIFRQQFIAALEGEGDLNGDGYVTGAELGQYLQDNVVNYSKGAQHPQYGKIRHPSLDKGDFVFQIPGAAVVEATTTPATTPSIETQQQVVTQTTDPESEMWELVKNSDDVSDVEDFLSAFPDGEFAKVAQLKLKQLTRQQEEGQMRSEAPEETAPFVPEPEAQQEPQELFEKLPEERDGEDVPEEIVLLTRLLERVVEAEGDLRKTFETRNANQIERRVRIVGKVFDKGIQEAIDRLEPSELQVHTIERLHELHGSFPGYIEEFLHLVKSGDWEALPEELTLQATEEVVDLEGFQRQQDGPLMWLRALQQVRDDMFAMRKLLVQIVEQRDAAQFEPLLREMEEVTLADIERALDIMLPPPSAEVALEALHEIREGLRGRLEGAIELAWQGEWDALEREWEPAWQEFTGHIEDRLQEIEHLMR